MSIQFFIQNITNLSKILFIVKKGQIKFAQIPLLQKIILNNSIKTLKKDLKLMSVLTGTEVQSYVADDHCCILFHMQHDTEHELKHGLRIDTKSGKYSSIFSFYLLLLL